MQKLLFFCRVVLICNICFALAWLLKYFPQWQNGMISSTILVLGVGVATALNVAITLLLALTAIIRPQLIKQFPRWLIIVNLIFLFFQLILLLK